MNQHIFQGVALDDLGKNNNNNRGSMFNVCSARRTSLELSRACRSYQKMRISSNCEGELKDCSWMTRWITEKQGWFPADYTKGLVKELFPQTFRNIGLNLTGVFLSTQFWGFFFSLFRRTCGSWEFLGQGSNLSTICDLHHSCGNTRSLTHCTGGTKPAMPQRQARSLTHCTTAGTQIWGFKPSGPQLSH